MSFLEDSKPVWSFYPIANAPIAVEASFDWRRFQTTDFNAHKILMPPALSNAVAKRQAEFLAGRLCARWALELAGNTNSLQTFAWRPRGLFILTSFRSREDWRMEAEKSKSSKIKQFVLS